MKELSNGLPGKGGTLHDLRPFEATLGNMGTHSNHDVAVVGGGVAGAAVAIHLARRGRSVLLLDRARFPRRKACGEGLFPRGVRELRELGVLEGLGPLTALEVLRFHGYGHSAEARLGSPGHPALGIRRDLLDEALLARAAAEGVDVVTGSPPARLEAEARGRFALVAGERRVDTRAIVAADGLGSGLRRAAGLADVRAGRRFGVSAHVELLEDLAPVVDVHFRRGFEIYITPVGERCANVAVLLSRPQSRSLAGDAGSFLRDLLGRERCLPDGWRLADEPLVAGPFPVRPGRLWCRNLVLAGDAAGFFDGITGEGMSLALASARHCAEAVDAFLETGHTQAFREYERQRRRLARNSELLGRLTLLMASREWTARRAIRGLARRPEAFSRLVAFSAGEASLRDLRPFDLLTPLLG